MGQLKEIRIYFEALEQADSYFLPIVEKICKNKEVPVKIVKRSKTPIEYSKNIAPIVYGKDIDVLITAIVDDEEYPLFAIELSTAVFTEDHELQRFDALLAPVLNNTIPVKISPLSKQSSSQHGGNTDFDYVSPYHLIKTKYGKNCFHFDWNCDEKYNVIIDKNNLSCPPLDQNFEELLKIGIDELKKFTTIPQWILNVSLSLEKKEFFHNWFDKVKNVKLQDITKLKTSRLSWIKSEKTLKKNALELKLNRFGHAMDPERGMIPFYSIQVDFMITKMRFTADKQAWYKDTAKEKIITEYIKTSRLKKPYDYLYCFALASGLHSNVEFMKLVANHKTINDKIILDITDFISKNYSTLNKPLRIIFGFSDLFVIEDVNKNRKVELKFTRQLNNKEFETLPKITPISTPSNFTEDEITYIIVHDVFKKNNLDVISVSYPGAQADRVMLIEKNTGRGQQREYIDIVAKDQKNTFLFESKPIFSKTKIQSDIDKLTLYKSSQGHKIALNDFHKKFSPGFKSSQTIIGVGFLATSFDIESDNGLKTKDLDYYVYISKDMKSWSIKELTGSHFRVKSGEVTLPKYFEISK
ncbi:MAG: hypothetical protein EXR16_05640 [Bacteroidetes bacterium]|nr:hypothetical protein [Bacteroidota bacterium]